MSELYWKTERRYLLLNCAIYSNHNAFIRPDSRRRAPRSARQHFKTIKSTIYAISEMKRLKKQDEMQDKNARLQYFEPSNVVLTILYN